LKKLFLISLILLLSFFTSNAQEYTSKYADKWKQINDSIRNNWDDELSKSADLPNPYTGAFKYLPFMFYWDTYFINMGLNIHKYDAVAKFNTENLLSVVDKYGFVGNASITPWGMNRSQPPYLSVMVRDVYESRFPRDTNFLKKAYQTLKKDYLFWTDTSKNAIEQHKTAVKGLQRFFHHAKDVEIEPQFEEIASRFNLPKNISFEQKVKTCIPYIVEAATGMDFTPRFEHRCPDFVAVELNALLYTYEKNLGWMATTLRLTNEPDWNKLAEERKKLMNKYLWNEKRGLYLDYDFVNKRGSKVAAATTFQPLWAGIATKEQAAQLVKNLPLLESEWGIATTEKCGEIKNYQWGETSVWAPMQTIAIMGLDQYGYEKEAKRLAQKYLDLVAKNYFMPVPESFISDKKEKKRVVGKLFEKYKVDGTINDDEYKANEMQGWSAGTFAFCYQYVLTH